MPSPNSRFVSDKRTNINLVGRLRNQREQPANSHSLKARRFEFTGPYSQNLKKPKLFEARGT